MVVGFLVMGGRSVGRYLAALTVERVIPYSSVANTGGRGGNRRYWAVGTSVLSSLVPIPNLQFPISYLCLIPKSD